MASIAGWNHHGVVHTDEFILTAVKGFIKQSRGYTLGLMSCYRRLRKQGWSIDYKQLRRITVCTIATTANISKLLTVTIHWAPQVTCLIVALMNLASMKAGSYSSPRGLALSSQCHWFRHSALGGFTSSPVKWLGFGYGDVAKGLWQWATRARLPFP